ncbi:von Willebrand factor-like [Saccoglossus kowalevskii]|uniref:Kielin/chordin-like protein-like n=1 Tax=Saccoglossus kowalevskii TaxID=10224 RepID=A0ABM0MPV4_SACKO|nr:PREDICTED: kielin/chordin-like protein-like [Saccoglossus kowalevskii]
MKLTLLLVLAILPIISAGNIKRAESKLERCEPSDEDECTTSPAINGKCKVSCENDEKTAAGRSLCCKGLTCCHKSKDACSRAYEGAFCDVGPCDPDLVQINNDDLCRNGFVCCKSKPTWNGIPDPRPGELGDPQFETFDGFHFSYQGPCMYYLVQEDSVVPNFSVMSKHVNGRDEKGQSVTFVSSVHIDYYGYKIDLLQGYQVMVDSYDISDDLPKTYSRESSMSFTIRWANANRNLLVAEFPGLFEVIWNGKSRVIVELEKEFKGKGQVHGMLGNNNGDLTDDLEVRKEDGNIVLLYPIEMNEDGKVEHPPRYIIDQFGEMWLVPNSCKH